MKFKSIYVLLALMVVGAFTLFNSYNSIQTHEEKVFASWAEVVNQYQRRMDLVPNLVNTVKGYTQHEQSLLTQVTDARARVGTIQINVNELPSEQVLAQYQQAQQQLSSSLGRLIAVSENYPELKSSQLYADLMAQLEGTENRIAVARGRYIEAIQQYNSYIRRLPGKLLADYYDLKPKPQFSVENEKAISSPPTVSF